MSNIRQKGILILLCALALGCICGFTSQVTGADFSAYDMVSAVNNLRAAKGVSPVQVNAILMSVAQDHSDYQASMSRSSHTGRNGGIVNDRVEASGYAAGRQCYAGENVAVLDLRMTGMLQIIVYEIWSDAGHYGAMVNPNYTDAGVGIASDGKSVYVTLNLAGIKEPASQSDSNAGSSDSENPEMNPDILPLFTTTPKADGAVYHTVGYGQTLGTIARMYGVDMNDLAAINNIEPDKIFAGQNLFIRYTTPVPPTEIPTETPVSSQTSELSQTPEPSVTFTPARTNTLAISTIEPDETPIDRPREIGIVVIFMLFSITIVLFLTFRKVK